MKRFAITIIFAISWPLAILSNTAYYEASTRGMLHVLIDGYVAFENQIGAIYPNIDCSEQLLLDFGYDFYSDDLHKQVDFKKTYYHELIERKTFRELGIKGDELYCVQTDRIAIEEGTITITLSLHQYEKTRSKPKETKLLVGRFVFCYDCATGQWNLASSEYEKLKDSVYEK